MELARAGLGRRKQARDGRRVQALELGAGGRSKYLSSATKPPWPAFRHMLPEVALAGHSNCGKSTLLNSLVGVAARRGPARVSDRAGWTDALFWYQVGARPPTLTLVDLPGYGHAVADGAARERWGKSTKRYLSERAVLCRCCVLVDATRGLCGEDVALLRFLREEQRPHQVVLTMGDMLSPTELAWAAEMVDHDLRRLVDANPPSKPPRTASSATPGTIRSSSRGRVRGGSIRTRDVPVVSGHTGAGVNELWRQLAACAKAVSYQAPEGHKQGRGGPVPIHLSALK